MPSHLDAPAASLAGDAAYRVIQTHDARFDGRLFVGVTSTRIYCRPVCRVRTPLQRHCRFFRNAASAEQAGFRPCRRCRPELAPGLSLVDSSQALAAHAAQWLLRAAREGQPLAMPALARHLGVTDRHLRRIFVDAHGVAPHAFLTTQRLLFAKHLLSDTSIPVTQVALLSGFRSLRRFNDAFATHYRMAPSDLRKGEVDNALRSTHDDGITLRLAYRPPYDIAGVLAFLARRAMPGVEHVDVAAMRIDRALRVDSVVAAAANGRAAKSDAPRDAPSLRSLFGWVSITFDPARHEVRVSLAPTLLPVVGRVIELVRNALDLDADPDAMAAVLASVPAPHVAGLRVPGSFDAFETVVRIILGQQITVAAARTLALRVIDRFGEAIDAVPAASATSSVAHASSSSESESESTNATRVSHVNATVTRVFPSPAVLAAASADSLGSLGIVSARVGAIRAVAQAIVDGRLRLDRTASIDATLDTLRSLPGIGEWTTQLIAMRVLAWPDAFMASDVGVLKALGHRQPRLADTQSQAWKPWRSYAVVQLWRSLESGT